MHSVFGSGTDLYALRILHSWQRHAFSIAQRRIAFATKLQKRAGHRRGRLQLHRKAAKASSTLQRRTWNAAASRKVLLQSILNPTGFYISTFTSDWTLQGLTCYQKLHAAMYLMMLQSTSALAHAYSIGHKLRNLNCGCCATCTMKFKTGFEYLSRLSNYWLAPAKTT